MRIEPLGDAAFIVRGLGSGPAFPYVEVLQRLGLAGVVEVVASYDTLGVYVDPDQFSLSELASRLESLPVSSHAAVGKLHEVPVCYELGEDLERCCEELGLSESAFVGLHSGREYLCYAVGFAPGFPYLGYLPKEVSGLSRLPAPRRSVPAGAVGVMGDQTGIYPGGRPGGWRLVGATPLEIVSLDDSYFPIKAGDRVVFSPIALAEYESLKGERL
ncbi:MAG: carboxyltransferase domain-containing protein [Fimbriimonadaceae bacterium]